MDNLLDVFKGDGFSLATLTDAINKEPFVPGRVGELNIFKEQGINTLTANIEEREGKLYLVPAAPRGGVATQNIKAGRKLRPISHTHLPLHDTLMADEIQGIRAFGSTSVLETIQSKLNEKLATMAQSMEATHEYQRVGALKGLVHDADGATILYDLYDIFGVLARNPVDFKLYADNPGKQDIRAACNTVIREMQDDMGAMPYQGIYALVGKDFMDGLSMAPETIEAFKRWQEGQNAGPNTFVRSTFKYGGIMFEEYRGNVGDVQFIDDNEARFFPVGMPGLFRMLYSPADYVETVNTEGRAMYAKQILMPNGKGIEIEVQSNPIPYCTRPRLLRQGLARS